MSFTLCHSYVTGEMSSFVSKVYMCSFRIRDEFIEVKMEKFDGFEYTKKDLIGHGAFAIVYKGRYADVSSQNFSFCLTYMRLKLARKAQLRRQKLNDFFEMHSGVKCCRFCCPEQ
ncbi:unnamed protein product [Gongylonema pulchrum]|uniref:Protein kinase domain-containing protein n=1 Tax=Gongylonema pulchrum TaxID=637853 RepID=A0A183DD04_9BILA|nr:unnamed protein product [Gongylonema pulchrum]